jgi:heat shock protein 4
MVSFQGKQRFVGESAVTLARNNYKNTVSCFKRFIGRKFNDPDVQEEIKKFVHNKMVELENGNVGVTVNYDGEDRVMSMEILMAMMLMHLRDLAKAAIGQEVVSAVLSVPGFWTDVQRRGLLDAVGIAGLNVSSLMNETTATALAYGIYKNARKEFDARLYTLPPSLPLSLSLSLLLFVPSCLVERMHSNRAPSLPHFYPACQRTSCFWTVGTLRSV